MTTPPSVDTVPLLGLEHPDERLVRLLDRERPQPLEPGLLERSRHELIGALAEAGGRGPREGLQVLRQLVLDLGLDVDRVEELVHDLVATAVRIASSSMSSLLVATNSSVLSATRSTQTANDESSRSRPATTKTTHATMERVSSSLPGTSRGAT